MLKIHYRQKFFNCIGMLDGITFPFLLTSLVITVCALVFGGCFHKIVMIISLL